MAKPPEQTNRRRAPAVQTRLEAAEIDLALLVGQIAEVQLDEVEGIEGAAERMAELSAKVQATRDKVDNLKASLQLALKLDRRADASGRAKIRASQLAAMVQHVEQRDAAVADLCAAAKTMAIAYQKYSEATLKMVGVTPIGTRLPTMMMGPNGVCGSIVGNLEPLISAEMYRHGVESGDGMKFTMPLVKLVGFDRKPLEPGLDVFREAQTAMMRSIKEQIAHLDKADSEFAETPKLKAS